MDMQEQLRRMEEEAQSELSRIADRAGLDALRLKMLGKKGELTQLLRSMGQLPAQERPQAGQMIVQGKDDTFPAGQTFKQTVAAQTEMIVQREKKQTLIRANPADAVIVEGKSARTGTGRMQQRRQILFETHGFHERLTSCWKGRKTGQGPAGTHARNGGRERFSFEKGKTRGGGTAPPGPK